MAVVFWGAMTLFVVPMVLDRAEAAARQRAAPPAAAPEATRPLTQPVRPRLAAGPRLNGTTSAMNPRQVECRMCMMSPSWTT